MTEGFDPMAEGRDTTMRDVTGGQDPVLAEILDRLVATYRPERIYLFGSHARGATTSDSDYDLMVVGGDDTPVDARRSARAYGALWDLHTAVDVLVWPRTAFEERLHLRASLPSSITREGKLVYSR